VTAVCAQDEGLEDGSDVSGFGGEEHGERHVLAVAVVPVPTRVAVYPQLAVLPDGDAPGEDVADSQVPDLWVAEFDLSVKPESTMLACAEGC
jgi:hypothetical protein